MKRLATVPIAGAIASLLPVAVLAWSRFVWGHYDQPGLGYFAYNLARMWMLVVMLAAFWGTGRRVCHKTTNTWDDAIEHLFAGAAIWSIGVTVLAAVHLYYSWIVFPLLGLAIAGAISDVQLMPQRNRVDRDTGLAAVAIYLLQILVVVSITMLLTTSALWGDFGDDNDVPGNYLPYYEQVLTSHGSSPGGYWVHFFASKGNGLGLLANVLSDANGAALASFLLILMGAMLIWRLADRAQPFGRVIAPMAVVLYLQFYGMQDAYAKQHGIRNVFIVYLLLSFTYSLIAGVARDTVARIAVAVAIVVLSPLAILAVLPLMAVEAIALAMLGERREAKSSAGVAAAGVGAALIVCGYNFLVAGLPELHAMPAWAGRLVNVDRLRHWIDPGLAYLDERLYFVRAAWSTDATTGGPLVLAHARPFADVIAEMLNPGVIVFVTGALAVAFVAWQLAADRGVIRQWRRPLAAAGHLSAVLVVIALVKLFTSGQGSSIPRVINFAAPVAIALAVIILTCAVNAVDRRAVPFVGAGMIALALGSIAIGYPAMRERPWRAGAQFLIGQTSYAAMHDQAWDTEAGWRLARKIPEGHKAELLNFLPGFTAIPATPYQRPDGCVYLKDYTRVLYGSAADAADVYAAAGVDYFVFDLSPDAHVVWTGFSALFTSSSIRDHLTLVAHDVSRRRDLYLFTWKDQPAAAGDRELDGFLRRWDQKRERERAGGYFYGTYAAGARLIGGK